MKATALPVLLVATLFFLAPARAHAASVDPEVSPAFFAGHAYYDMGTRTLSWEANPAPLAAVDVYSNTSSPATWGISSTDLNAKWGDEVTMTSPGLLDQFDFTFFNSETSAGPVMQIEIELTLMDGPTHTVEGLFGTILPFSDGGVPPGYYTIITLVNLANFAGGTHFPGKDVFITQQVTGVSGGANDLGVAGLSPVTVGTGSPAMFIDASTIGPAGFYTLNGIPSADPGYRLAILQPVPAKGTTWGGVKGKYRN